jgi:2-C-methyl-D-erythritol 4-phosphate cytidylyltransferase
VTSWAIVVAAGRAERYGTNKLHELINGKRCVDWSIGDAMASCDGVVVVGEDGVAGGATRSQSVRNGLAAVPDDADVIVVHDAARPAAGVALFHAVIDAIRAGADAAVPGVPVTDTIRVIDGGTLDRSTLVAVQTPQAFRADALRAAHAAGREATDDAALVEQNGGRVVVVPGHAGNRKLTTPGDLAALEAALR